MARFIADLPDEGGAYKASQFEGDFLGDRHRRIHDLVDSVPGKLRHADELKLYEMAYMARGPILEIGTDQGRSLAIMAIATRDAQRSHELFSVDISDRAQGEARENLSRLGLLEFVNLVHGDSSRAVLRMRGDYDLVFVDGDHTRDGVARDLRAIRGKVNVGGSVLFHDYYDARNDDPGEPLYGVPRRSPRHGRRTACASGAAAGLSGFSSRFELQLSAEVGPRTWLRRGIDAR